ncbi:MAG: hypothetical protein IAE77_13320 [Prosthecobacter sp.]|jgi:hypothetical protein|uniref:hypothetical protein n=1 Tax=Prosthecobacter sp. TaxID=1965333 RepID=UPI0019F613CC|nr:hypothetical protein [Prosthecobacter sp.]MBE2284431.1 hypothetical protein [Prosthecobacter sp.]
MLESLDTLIAFVVIISVASLVVTVVVQTLSALFTLRGRQLARGLQNAGNTFFPAASKELAHALLTEPNFIRLNRLASAVRPDEIHERLQKIAQGNTTVSIEAAALLKALTPDTQKAAAVEEILGGLVKTLNVTCFSSTERQTLNTAIQTASQQLVQTVDNTKTAVEAWFNDAVDRAQQWFLGWIRLITIGVGLILAFWFQWDAVEIFQKVSGPNNTLRDALVAKSAIVLEKGDGVLKVSEVGGGLLERLQKQWNAKAKPDLKLESLEGIKKAQDMENRILALVKDDEAAAKAALNAEVAQKIPPGPAPTEREIAAKKAEMTDARRTEVQKEFDAMIAIETKAYFDSQQDAITALAKEVSQSGFELIPQNGSRWPKEGRRPHILGMLIFAALLSLGAPFWFNLLKNLSDLRPALAKLLDPETKPSATPAK